MERTVFERGLHAWVRCEGLFGEFGRQRRQATYISSRQQSWLGGSGHGRDTLHTCTDHPDMLPRVDVRAHQMLDGGVLRNRLCAFRAAWNDEHVIVILHHPVQLSALKASGEGT